MIFGISGRKNTGKTTLSERLIERGFKRASFATPLKEYVAKLFNWEIGSLYTQQGKEELLDNPVFWNKQICDKLEDLAQINLNFTDEVKFCTRRDALQYIGTDVLRDADPEFHVKKFAEKFIDGDYVVDDVRFLNEVDTLKKMNGVCVHIIRPYNWVYSNHDSEISVSRKDVDYVVLNDSSQHKMVRKFDMFLDGLFSKRKKPISKIELIEVMNQFNGDTKEAAKYLKCSTDKIVWWATKYMINIDRNTYKLNHDAFFRPSKEAAYWAGVISADGTIKKHLVHDYLVEFSSLDVELVQGLKYFLNTNKPIYEYNQPINNKTKHSLTFSSPYIIEDLKLWNVEPLKSKNNHIPDCIKNNEELLCYWLVGLIDGDGSIYLAKEESIRITILASLQIIDFLKEWLDIPCSKSQEKDIENLFNLKFCGKNALALYKKIYKGMGLKRKWDKVIPFLDKEWHH
ncbi:MAG: hypothetical protein EKK64_10380 [Neisseriaceae bacterium]|nr:MAG: hypothetical protein EKK64_10380 [Neisseriaceae bacterium]